MFRNAVTDTPLTSRMADTVFSNISGYSFNNDVSFLATLRALVAPRMQENDVLSLFLKQAVYSQYQISRVTPKDVVNAVCNNTIARVGCRGAIQIVTFDSNDTEDNEACLDAIQAGFLESNPDWARLEKVTDFFRRSFRVICYINVNTRCVFLFTSKLDLRKYHYLQCATLAFLPWYFNPEDGISEDELDLINSLREKTSSKYEECINKIAGRYNFRAENIKRLLDGFETRFIRAEADDVKNSLDSVMRTIADYNTEIGNLLRTKYGYEVQLLGLEAKMNESGKETSEIMEYFLCNDNLVLEEVNDDAMVFSCKGYVEYYDEDAAKAAIDNKRSYVYMPYGSSYNNYIKSEDMQKLMCAIFIDQKLRLKLCAAYQFNLRGGVNALSNHRFGYEFNDCIPNTHIDAYSCMGNYTQTINEVLQNNDYIIAIEQCVASCKSLNFHDSIVMEKFMHYLYGAGGDSINISCIELPDGSVTDPKGAIKWLNEQEAEQEFEQESEEEGAKENE